MLDYNGMYAYDIRPETKEQILSLGAKAIELDIGEGGSGEGGYAKELSDEAKARQQQALADELAQAHERVACFSPEMDDMNRELKQFLRLNLYQHYRVTRMAEKAQRILTDLFKAYLDKPRQLPPHIYGRIDENGSAERVICDYMAGMTDKYALEEHKKLFDPHEKV